MLVSSVNNHPETETLSADRTAGGRKSTILPGLCLYQLTILYTSWGACWECEQPYRNCPYICKRHIGRTSYVNNPTMAVSLSAERRAGAGNTAAADILIIGACLKKTALNYNTIF
jgi:hypothetical protein